MKGSLSRIFRGAGGLAMLLAAQAQSQTPPAEQPEDSKLEEEIVVTGTLLRGVAPTGAEVIGLSTEDIAAIGAVSTTQLLASVPQIRGFGTTPAVLGANKYQLAVNRPNLRNLPGVDLNGGNPTLLIMDGHRLPGAGIIQTAPDADILPPSVIERVQVIPDGGSATYGSDAIGGVINYITQSAYRAPRAPGRSPPVAVRHAANAAWRQPDSEAAPVYLADSAPAVPTPAGPGAQQPLDDIMLAMDVVDTIRRRERVLQRELDAEGREADLTERLRKIYQAQGIDVPDHVIAQGVAALKEGRFVYTPPADGLGTKLARLYVSRGRWGKWALGALGALVVAGTFYYATVVAPTADLPRRLQARHAEVLQAAATDDARGAGGRPA